MQRISFNAPGARSLVWAGDVLVDWAGGAATYQLDGVIKRAQVNFGGLFDACIASKDHRFAFMYGRLKTKGLLLKSGKFLREINRSYYQAEAYEYPAAFAQLDGRTILIHCPNAYNRIEFEDAETGELLTTHSTRKPSDVFHSRFEVSTDNRYLLSKGWCWHPVDVVQAFDIPACVRDPSLLDESTLDPTLCAPLNTASFVSAGTVLIGSVEGEESFERDDRQGPLPGEIATWNIGSNVVSASVKVEGPFGDVYAIDERRCWDLYKYPKVIDIRTGQVLDAMPDLLTGERNSSIIWHLKLVPSVSLNRETGQIAILNDGRIDVLSP